MKSSSSAKGIRGQIIQTICGVVFRVYNSNYDFIDYDLCHLDLDVIVDDDDAFFYENNKTNKLDYSLQTRGGIV
jgi:hypothetical protein